MTLNKGYFWIEKVKTAHDAFNLYEPFQLLSGSYILYGGLYSYSYIENSDGIKQWNDYFNNSIPLINPEFTLSESVILYLCYNKNTYGEIRVINKTGIDIPISSIPYEKGLVYGKLNEKIDVINYESSTDTSYYDQAFIKNGELTCNNDHQNINTSIAKYTCVDMGSNIIEMRCKGYFKSLANEGQSITLISTNLNTYSNVQNITRGSIHIGFGINRCGIELYIDNSMVSLNNQTYTIEANTEYEFGWGLDNNTLTIYLPDGNTISATDERISNLNGKYAIFEHFKYRNETTETPICSFGQPVITSIYCKCSSGAILRDNFKRADGPLNISPTGHIYTQFRNTTGNDSRYDNEGASLNY